MASKICWFLPPTIVLILFYNYQNYCGCPSAKNVAGALIIFVGAQKPLWVPISALWVPEHPQKYTNWHPCSLPDRALHGAGNPWGIRFPTGNGWKRVNFWGKARGGAEPGGWARSHHFSSFKGMEWSQALSVQTHFNGLKDKCAYVSW